MLIKGSFHPLFVTRLTGDEPSSGPAVSDARGIFVVELFVTMRGRSLCCSPPTWVASPRWPYWGLLSWVKECFVWPDCQMCSLQHSMIYNVMLNIPRSLKCSLVNKAWCCDSDWNFLPVMSQCDQVCFQGLTVQTGEPSRISDRPKEIDDSQFRIMSFLWGHKQALISFTNPYIVRMKSMFTDHIIAISSPFILQETGSVAPLNIHRII